MIVFPLAVVALNGVFSVRMGRQFVERRKPHQLAWLISLLLGFLAGVFYVLFLLSDHNVSDFKLYYLCGAVLMAAYLGIGSMYLHAPRAIGHVAAGLVTAAGIAAAISLFQVQTEATALASAAKALGPGTSALASGPWKAFTAALNSFGAVAVVGGAVYSAWRIHKRQAEARFLWANLLIAAGTLLAAAAGVVADQGAFAGAFWAVLAMGFAVLFAGFVLATGRRGS